MRFAFVLLLTVAIGACGSAAPASSSASPRAAEPTATINPPPSPTVEASSPSASAASASSDQPLAIVGTWARTQSCEDELAAFKHAGFLDMAQEWVTGNWVGEHATVTDGKFCDGSAAPRDHSHFFVGDGSFGSLDQHGSQVDDGQYVLKDPETIQFPKSEFGYEGGPVVGYSVSGDTALFTVTVPDPCTDSCRQAYAWALSAFFGSDPWVRQPAR